MIVPGIAGRYCLILSRLLRRMSLAECRELISDLEGVVYEGDGMGVA